VQRRADGLDLDFAATGVIIAVLTNEMYNDGTLDWHNRYTRYNTSNVTSEIP